MLLLSWFLTFRARSKTFYVVKSTSFSDILLHSSRPLRVTAREYSVACPHFTALTSAVVHYLIHASVSTSTLKALWRMLSLENLDTCSSTLKALRRMLSLESLDTCSSSLEAMTSLSLFMLGSRSTPLILVTNSNPRLRRFSCR